MSHSYSRTTDLECDGVWRSRLGEGYLIFILFGCSAAARLPHCPVYDRLALPHVNQTHTRLTSDYSATWQRYSAFRIQHALLFSHQTWTPQHV